MPEHVKHRASEHPKGTAGGTSTEKKETDRTAELAKLFESIKKGK